ncbi:glycerate kinase [Actinokineospora sp. HUAS TT18]|uniref:glycerate kinase n=1 Tax=Actinokineospora sp. HUAS TT18 TaxID=3447451 RepID=UPI003F5259FF
MKIVIAPDSFKGTATAAEAAQALSQGWRDVRARDELVALPMADGGEGTADIVAAAHPGATVHQVPGCTGPDGRAVTGSFAMLPDGCAVIDIATASGLPLMAAPDALAATSRGTGEVIAAAMDHGATRLLIGLGGSASTDGGASVLAALGARFTDSHGEPLPDGGGSLGALTRVDLSGLRPPPRDGVTLLTDVRNPLLGTQGAAAVYGPQKGADPGEVTTLEQGLTLLSALLGGDPGRPGMGAAGGVAYGLATAWGAVTLPGSAAVADLVGVDRVIADADLVITGEGRFDRTSLHGKAVGEILSRAMCRGVPARVVAGDATDSGVLTLVWLAEGAEAARRDALVWLRRAGAALAREIELTAAVP